MSKDLKQEVDGIIVETLPGARFKVKIVDPPYLKDLVVTGYIAGKMRMHFIRIIPGDRVRIELDPTDMSKGRITFRNK